MTMPKTAVITGASRGIGRATARLFAENGYNVVIHYHNSYAQAEELRLSLEATGASVLCVKANVAVRDEVDELVGQTLSRFGGIDVLVNNAGIAQQKLFTDITKDDWNNMLGVNLGGVFHCCQAVVPHMIQHKAGHIVNVSSIWGLTGASCEVHYSAVKAGIIGLTKALAKELGPSNIQINCVAPGVVATDMLSDFSQDDLRALAEETPLQRLGTPLDIAQAIYFLGTDASSFITGQVLSPNGGFVI